MSDASAGAGLNAARPGPSVGVPENTGPYVPTGVPVVDTATRLGPLGATYKEEFVKLVRFMRVESNLVGPATTVIYVHVVRQLYEQARWVAAEKALGPYNKCMLLFHIFDALVQVYKNLSFVYCGEDGARSVYGYSQMALKTMLSRVEAIARQVAVGVHDTYSLTALNRILATAEQRLASVQTERDMMEFFRTVSSTESAFPSDAFSNGSGTQLPRGVERYSDPYPEVATLLERLYAANSDKNYIREFHDSVFLVATSNAPQRLSGALETRLADKDRNIILFDAPGDRLFSSTMCASAIGFLRKRLHAGNDGSAVAGRSSNEIQTYRINYGRIFSKYRGESERNFDDMMEWIKNKVRASDTFRIFWFPDIENLMAPRSSVDQEHIASIKNSMLQHMDVFNKDRTLRSYLLLFNSSEGLLDAAFARRLETIVRSEVDPLTDASVATQVVAADLARYHINLTDDLARRVARQVGARDEENSRVGGFAQVQAMLRDMYVSQKLMLSNDVRAVATRRLSSDSLNTLIGRYDVPGSRDTLYDLEERPVAVSAVDAVAFSAASRLATLYAGQSYWMKHNASLQSDPKNIDRPTAARTVFVHDI